MSKISRGIKRGAKTLVKYAPYAIEILKNYNNTPKASEERREDSWPRRTPKTYHDEKVCDRCYGKGVFYKGDRQQETCFICNGTGKVKNQKQY